MTGLTAERVRRDVEVVARAGLEIDTFLEESIASISRAVPFTSACLATVDPSTRLLTGARKYGDLLGRNDHDHEFGLVEYGESEPTAFMSMAESRVAAAGVHISTDGDLDASPRLSRFIEPLFGYADEMRAVCREGDRVWGGLALFREPGVPHFGQDEIDFMATLAHHLALGLRSGMLAALAGSTAPTSASGPTSAWPTCWPGRTAGRPPRSSPPSSVRPAASPAARAACRRAVASAARAGCGWCCTPRP
jgi:hypothetical protein